MATKTAELFKNRIVGYDTKPADQFTANPLNYRKHPQRQRDAVNASLRELGWISTVVENVTTGNVIDGHERIWQALQRNEDVPYLKVELSEAEERLALAVFDPITNMAETDAAILDDLLREVNTGEAALQALLAELADGAGLYGEKTTGDTPAEVDRAEELRQKWGVQPGQLWSLGEHKLVCGDCTDAATVARVMGGERADCVFTSPPYNSASELHGNDKFRGSLYLDKSIDAMTPEQYLLFNRSVFAVIKSCLADNGNVYYNISYNKNNRSGYIFVVANAIADGFNLYETIVWKKKGMPNPASTDVLTRDFEFVFLFNQSATYRTNKANNEARTNVWDISNMGTQEDNHKACFPVELPSRGILESTQTGGIVYEPFCGSGTTIIACENLGRKCRGVELSPSYVGVTLERFQQHTGKTPVMVEHGSAQ